MIDRRTGRSGTATSLIILLVMFLAACSSAPEVAPRSIPVPTAIVTPTARAEPVEFPRDDAPHDVLTEWWYYTGHLQDEVGARFGFEFVIFQSVRGNGPVGYAAHFAITDIAARRFVYDQRTSIGSQIGPTDRFDLDVAGWKMSGSGGSDHLSASMPGYALSLDLLSTKPAILHGGTGIISFGPAGESYYYSRTRLEGVGQLTVDGQPRAVEAIAWMDHQWGNFISAGGSWDWFSMQFEDRTELTGSVVRDDAGQPVLIYGTYVDAQGDALHLDADEFLVRATDHWTSPNTGATYPAGWSIGVPTLGLDLEIEPVLPDQELDTRPTTGVIYWEGAVDVRGRRNDAPLRGVGYVELTGYAAGVR